MLTARVRERRQGEVLNSVRVHRVGFDSLKEWVYFWLGSRAARGRVGGKPSKPSLPERFAAWVYKTIWKNLFFPDDACVWYFPAKRQLCQLLESQKFDAVITVSLPFTGHLLGLVAKRTSRRLDPEEIGIGKLKPIWLADIGDPFSFQAKPPNNAFFFDKINRRLERQVLETADAVSVTTEATLRKYRAQFGEKAVAKMTVIPPLFRSAPTEGWKEKMGGNASFIVHRSSLSMGYFGALYAPTRTPDAFLDLLVQTFLLRPDLRGRLEIHFYGEIFPEFFEKLNAEPAVRLHGLCSREEAWRAMQEMDILLNIGNATDFQLPSKAVDYLAAGKPVLNLSYMESDPFAEFFQRVAHLEGVPQVSQNLIFNLKVENGRARNGELERWLKWLESEKPTLSEAEIGQCVAPFLVGNIARQYLALVS